MIGAMTGTARTCRGLGRVDHKRWWIGVVMAPLLACGCQKVLFPQNEPRTQYQKADTLRDRFTPLQEPDVFGNPKPALRARLAPSS